MKSWILFEDRICMKPPKDKLNIKGLFRIYKVFGRHYKKYWVALTIAYASLFITIGLSALQPWPLKLILDHLILGKPFPKSFAFLNPYLEKDPKTLLLILSVSSVIITIFKSIFSFINKFWISSTGDKISADIRERVFAHLQRLSLSFHESSQKGDLVYILTSDATKMKGVLIDFPQDFSYRVGTFVFYMVLIFALDWRLGLIGVGVVPFMFWATKIFGANLRTAMKKRRKKEGQVASVISENVTAMALVQAYGRQDEQVAKFNAENRQSLEAQLKALKLQRFYSRVMDFLVITSTALILYLGGKYALQGYMLPGTLVLIIAYLRELHGASEKFSGVFFDVAGRQVSGERLLEVLENDMVMVDRKGARPAPKFKGKIEFKNVSFSYKTGKEVLKNLNFTVDAGQTVALVGHSGAGKSTLISLLLHFYEPQKGQILIDGQDIRNFTLKSLRGQITVVLQNAKLFQQSIRDNIAFGKPDATEEEIIRAAKLAEAHEFIQELPQGYDTIMYEGGENLSGGQIQRINIARAIIRNTPIVILDELTTGLDARAEAKVNAAIKHLTQNKTTFIIAHKFSTVANADVILLLEEGELAHMGTHEELMKQSKEYRELYKAQFSWQQELKADRGAIDAPNGKEQKAAVPTQSNDT
ncbi:MAG: ABC transporter ATP-binding protein [Calditrichaeota bacterium]|nr:MAG: ABC transporter ATP-binding protein [Calditrichota bacterium]